MRMPLLFLSYGNSMIYAFGTAFFATLIAIPTGYALARWKSIWMKILFWCCVVLLFLPFQVTMLPQYILLDFRRASGYPLGDTAAGDGFPAADSDSVDGKSACAVGV